MKRLVMVVTAILAGLGIGDNPNYAACPVQTAASQAEVAIVPVAVSVGIPVASSVPYYYSYSQSASPQQVDVEAIATRVVEKLQARPSGPEPSASTAKNTSALSTATAAMSSMVANKCVRCHGGPAPKHGLSLENLSTLDCPTRLTAIRAVLAERMPQGGPPLSPEECGRVLEELVGSGK